MDRFNQYVEALQKWRDEDHEDAKALTRNEIIVVLEGIYALREATNELLATHPAAFRKPGKIDNRTDNAVRIARLALKTAE